MFYSGPILLVKNFQLQLAPNQSEKGNLYSIQKKGIIDACQGHKLWNPIFVQFLIEAGA